MDKTLIQYSVKKKNVFEGYYFKHTFDSVSISFIVGFSTQDPHAFIQVIESKPTTSRYYRFDIKDIVLKNNPFSIQILNNYFSFEKIIVDLDDYIGEFDYNEFLRIKPVYKFKNIMGPFVMLPKMKCNHAIISMRHDIDVNFKIRDTTYVTNGIGYIEKDYGSTFPTNYVWMQCNSFSSKASLFFSLATIPYMHLSFDGVICSLIVNKKEYRFATYNKSTYKINECTGCLFSVTLRHKDIKLVIETKAGDAAELIAPNNGEMRDKIKESIEADVEYFLYEGKKLIMHEKSKYGSVELVNYAYFQNQK